jgi:transposase
LLVDKAYDADHLRQRRQACGTKIVIPSAGAGRHSYTLSRRACRRRNVIERMFFRIKDQRRIATRYDASPGIFSPPLPSSKCQVFG